jgi:hypothetical protein
VNLLGENLYQPLKIVEVPYYPLKILNFLISHQSYLLFLNNHHHPFYDFTVLN